MAGKDVFAPSDQPLVHAAHAIIAEERIRFRETEDRRFAWRDAAYSLRRLDRYNEA